MTAELDRARETLCRGAVVFAKWRDTRGRQSTEAHILRSKVTGNGLRELDRFLNLLIDETARIHDIPALPDQRNTAVRLRQLRAVSTVVQDDHDRLIALGRSRYCLFHCNGIARHGDAYDPATMLLGWPDRPGADQPLRRVPLGHRFALGPDNLESVGLFYMRLARTIAVKA